VLEPTPPIPPVPPAPHATARARARVEITHEIKAAARRQLGEVGSAGLSLRAVARELGMVSSAMYRYFPSRDELLTALIIDAYDALGEAVEVAEARVPRRNRRGRWMACCGAVRAWALEHRHEYALIYGSPVPGYAAPVATIGPATRVPRVLMGILDDHQALGDVELGPTATVPKSVRGDLRAIQDAVGSDVDDELLLAGLRAWVDLYGTVSFELFGQFQNVVSDPERFFDVQMRRGADALGL
jgi:AcrR family transcriptional regulator